MEKKIGLCNGKEESLNQQVSEITSYFNPMPIGVVYDRRKRWIILIIILCINTCINMDHGTIPVITNIIRNLCKVKDEKIGLLESLFFFGSLIGSMCFLSVIRKVNRKWVIILCLFIISASDFTFTITGDIYYLLSIRVLTGFFQAFISIYFPVWIDQFGPKKHKTIMMSLLYITFPVGYCLGYCLTFEILVIDQEKWRWTYYIQTILILFFSLIFMFCPLSYFSGKYYNLNKKKEIRNDKSSSSRGNKISDDISIFNDSYRQFGKNKKENICKDLKSILGNLIFTFSVLSFSVYILIYTTISFWISDYMSDILKLHNNEILLGYFILIISFILGISVGAFIFNKLGGPESQYSSIYCLLVAIIGFIFSIPLSFINHQDNIQLTILFLWFSLFFGSSIIPNLAGYIIFYLAIILSCLPEKQRSNANSILNIAKILIGCIPGPYLYGIISDYNSDHTKALLIVLYFQIISILFLSFVAIKKSGKCCIKVNQQIKIKNLIIPESNFKSNASLIAILWGNKDIEYNYVIERNEKITEIEQEHSLSPEYDERKSPNNSDLINIAKHRNSYDNINNAYSKILNEKKQMNNNPIDELNLNSYG